MKTATADKITISYARFRGIVDAQLNNICGVGVDELPDFDLWNYYNENEFMTYLMLGASLREAVQPYLRDSIKAAVNPTIATMATMGIVSLPGMMTGQILGGAMPMEAIKYQIGIMICIFTSMVVASLVNILLSLPVAFDDHQRLNEDIFR